MVGMRLFLQRGMAFWLRAACEYLGESRTPVATRREDPIVRYPLDLRAEAISILAGMILECPGEGIVP
jgi:hypothetical protein